MKLIKILAVMATLFGSVAHAEWTPTRPIKIVTGLPIGSGPDVVARKIADQLSVKLKQPVVVENKPGGSGIVGLDYYLQQPADGYTIYMGDFGNFVTMPILYKKDAMVDQMNILVPGYYTNWVVATPSSIRSFADLKSKINNKPFYGSWAVGSGGHLCGAETGTLLNSKTPPVHIPYKEYGTWFTDLINGQLSYSCASIGSSEQYKKAGKLNYVAIAADRRDPEYPDVPTIKELTGHNFKSTTAWMAFFINRNTPPEVAQRLEKELRSVLQTTDIKATIYVFGGKSFAISNKEFDRVRQQDYQNYKKLIKEFNIEIN